eukprot:CAMPEP_0114622584 /NCGR_PEP_ID=MMETSP0168-20121206/9813_1 /TAXON_ID=95228 ORGANISM="Vannella sp., Strain DIVA3 517/6/12" /NCGR_SAMPLE_ID=MMETSP0168 /ASSEMBLY_ACC=CAM_ASM_000044 /LENGTH=154 /DNA_ID=CAMNT_0001833805 /DNA_START=72 /DNA_END=536 /DNA_ORIENTATION=-
MPLNRRNGAGDGKGEYAAVAAQEEGEELVEHHWDRQEALGEDEELVGLVEAEDEEEEEELDDNRYRIAEKGDPFESRKKSIVLGVCLLAVGTVCLLLGLLIVTGVIETKHQDRGWPLVVVGLITFLPGSWASTISLMAYLKVAGYHIEELPSYE